MWQRLGLLCLSRWLCIPCWLFTKPVLRGARLSSHFRLFEHMLNQWRALHAQGMFMHMLGIDFSPLAGSDASHMLTGSQKLTFHEILPGFWFFFHLRYFFHLPIIPHEGFPPRLHLVVLRDVDFLHCGRIRKHMRKSRIKPPAEKSKQRCICSPAPEILLISILLTSSTCIFRAAMARLVASKE